MYTHASTSYLNFFFSIRSSSTFGFEGVIQQMSLQRDQGDVYVDSIYVTSDLSTAIMLSHNQIVILYLGSFSISIFDLLINTAFNVETLSIVPYFR